MATDIVVPTLGESVSEATIGRWFKKPGDTVKADEPLVELETDKVTIEVPAPSAGTLSEIVAADGATVAVGADGRLNGIAGLRDGQGGFLADTPWPFLRKPYSPEQLRAVLSTAGPRPNH